MFEVPVYQNSNKNVGHSVLRKFSDTLEIPIFWNFNHSDVWEILICHTF